MPFSAKKCCQWIGSWLGHPIQSAKISSFVPEILRGYQMAGGLSSPDGASSHHPPLENPLAQYFEKYRQGPGIWKWNHYFDVYHRHLQKFVGQEVTILEIGVFSGGSLRMWRNYFGAGCRVIGVDIEPASQAYADDRTEIYIGDQADRQFWQTVKQDVSAVDIVIDDGGHTSEQQMVTLEELLPVVRQGGVYIVEDIHKEQSGFTNFIHGLQGSLSAYNKVSDKPLTVQPNLAQQIIHSIHTYPFMAVIEKNSSLCDKLIAHRHGTEWQPPYPQSKE